MPDKPKEGRLWETYYKCVNSCGCIGIYPLQTYILLGLWEQLKGILPITLYLVLFRWIIFREGYEKILFVAIGLCSLIVGLMVFMEGLKLSIIPLGEVIGRYLPSRVRMWAMLLIAFLLGVFVTYSEPSIGVLVTLGSLVDPDDAPYLYFLLDDFSIVLVTFVAVGVGIAATISIMRFVYNWSLKPLIFITVPLTIGLSCYLMWGNPELKTIVGLAWDAGAITTGPVTVPVILALGLGVIKTQRRRQGLAASTSPLEGFGIVTLASLYPIISVNILAIIVSLIWSADDLRNRRGTVAPSNTPQLKPWEESPVAEIVRAAQAILPLIVLLLIILKLVLKARLPVVVVDLPEYPSQDAESSETEPLLSTTNLRGSTRSIQSRGATKKQVPHAIMVPSRSNTSLSSGGGTGDEGGDDNNDDDDDNDEIPEIWPAHPAPVPSAARSSRGSLSKFDSESPFPSQSELATSMPKFPVRRQSYTSVSPDNHGGGEASELTRPKRLGSHSSQSSSIKPDVPPQPRAITAPESPKSVNSDGLMSDQTSIVSKSGYYKSDGTYVNMKNRTWWERNRVLMFGFMCAFFGMMMFNWGMTYGLSEMGEQTGALLPALFQASDEYEGSPLFSYAGGIALVIVFGFLLGFLSTMSEPALNILGETVEDLTDGKFSKRMLLLAVSTGVASGVSLGLMKIIFNLDLIYLLFGGYTLACLLTAVSTEDFTNVAWDSAGVTTGPVTVPFILTLGLSLGGAVDTLEGFGILTMASVGPICSVLLMGVYIQLRQRF
eukprot:NODE_72_length_2540_cov_97.278077_g51_i0.p1 GENE.NODE_72_length_2540_cov_97.278077_g51_i0~~NODE_72_length_2540_cov_97.278077_g51_i0.p1  ORF type:complete len:775 (-),score=97.90 NODE_72_length_2540_cov_97.278077_g51_i0:113-2437(-)